MFEYLHPWNWFSAISRVAGSLCLWHLSDRCGIWSIIFRLKGLEWWVSGGKTSSHVKSSMSVLACNFHKNKRRQKRICRRTFKLRSHPSTLVVVVISRSCETSNVRLRLEQKVFDVFVNFHNCFFNRLGNGRKVSAARFLGNSLIPH